MPPKNEFAEFKIWISMMIDELIKDAVARGMPTDSIFRAIGAESLELAARMHLQHGGGDARRFLGMAKDMFELVRTGANEQ
jgi:hypothetical protein